ncbi:MAG: arginase family protein [Candidatus Hodarchaeales archaeon]|jgi:agmatinase
MPVLNELNSIYKRNTKCNFLFLGGDHLVTYFSVCSLAKSGFYNNKNIGIIYLDAHPDLYDNFEGDPYSHACVLRRIIDDTNISPSNIVQVGIRASTPKQVKFANQNDISMISRKEFHRKGPERIAQTINQSFNDNIDLVYLSIDMDVLDPGIVPGLGNPEPGGLLTSEVVDFIHTLSVPLHSFDIVEYCPKYDHSQITAFAAAKLIKETLPKIVFSK